MTRRRTVLPFVAVTAAILFAPCLTSDVYAENWPQFRGPGHNGVSSETSLPVSWRRDQNVAWRTEIPGKSWSSPIVWGNRVFVTTATDDGTSCRIVALDFDTGSIVWNKEVFRQVTLRKEERNSYATPTPATDGERVYACFGDGSFVAVDFTGEIVWTNRDYPFYSQHGLGTSPLLFEGVLIMARDGSSDGDDKQVGWQTPWDQARVIALDAATGRERWVGQRGLSRISHGTPCIWEHDGQVQVVSEAGDVVQGFSLETGERLWSSEVIGEGKTPSTLVGEGLVFTSGGWGGRQTIKAFRLGGDGDLKETNLEWEQERGTPKIPSMLYADSQLYALTDNGIVTCLNAGNGEVQWQKRLGGNFSACPVLAEGRLYLTSNEGLTTVLQLGEGEPQVVSENPLEEQVQASLAVSQGRLLLRTEAALYQIKTSTPSPSTK